MELGGGDTLCRARRHEAKWSGTMPCILPPANLSPFFLVGLTRDFYLPAAVGNEEEEEKASNLMAGLSGRQTRTTTTDGFDDVTTS